MQPDKEWRSQGRRQHLDRKTMCKNWCWKELHVAKELKEGQFGWRAVSKVEKNQFQEVDESKASYTVQMHILFSV